MTFRAKPAVKRSHRPAYEADHRRNVILTISFGLVVLVSLLILAGAAFATWYDDHLSAMAKVNGQSISKDDFRERARVETFRLDYQETQIRQLIQDGRMDDASGQSLISDIAKRRESIETDTMEALIDASLQGQLASQQGVTVTDQQVDAVIAKQSTLPETRHAWVMGVKPKVDPGATAPTDQQKADAKAAADKALAELKAGKAWADVAKTMTDDVYSSRDGEVGWITKAGSSLDTSINDALFALPVPGVTDVVEGSDGMFRIGQVTEIDPPVVDQAFQQKVKDQGVGMDAFRKAARADATAQALNDKIVADVVDQATPQRHVAEIFLKADSRAQQGTGDEVQVRHILYSPNDDASAAQSLPATDPAWKKAEDEANAAYAALQKDPSQFSAMATANSDDTGTKADGGLLPYYTKANLDPAFGTAIFQEGLVKDQILPPVKSAFGWHVIQYLDRRKQPSERMKDIEALASAPGADFAALAKQYSEAPSKDNGGDAGWIAKHQLDTVREIAIFKPAVGGLTESVTTASGIYLYKILAEETRKPDEAQAKELRANAFSNYFTAEKNFAHIERPYASSGDSVPVVQ
jgi:parvulin-like peptidyl-prolyl isomerase